jgi:hypothetical protein
MGFNRRKMEAQRAAAAEKEAGHCTPKALRRYGPNLLLKTRQSMISGEFPMPLFVGRRTNRRATTARDTLSNGEANQESEHEADGQS